MLACLLDVSGRRPAVASGHIFCAHAENTGIYSILASLHSIMQKDVDVPGQGALSQAFMSFVNMPKTPIFTAFLPLAQRNAKYV